MRVIRTVALVVALTVLPSGNRLSADDHDNGGDDGSDQGGGWSEDSIGAWVVDESTDEEEGEGGSHPEVASMQPSCAWLEAKFQRNDYFEMGVFEYRYIDLHFLRYRSDTGEAWIRTLHVCTYPDGSTTSEYVWRTTVDPDPRLLAESAYHDIEEEHVRAPEPTLSPVTTGVVNLGMWLAVAEPERDPISVTATAGNVSATTTATLTHTTFDMGDGSPLVSCDRVGHPIPPELIDTVEPSPTCGHTYSSTNGGAPFTITITSYWDVSWTSNTGAGGDLGTMDRTATVSYEVVEIQTVGGPGADG